MLLKAIAIFVGGGFGALLRFGLGWLIDEAIDRRTERLPDALPHFPLGTLAVNLIGCGLIGLLAAAFFQPGENGEIARPTLRLLIIVGLLGGFTTFSAFALETVRLVQTDRVWPAVAYVSLSNLLGIAAAVAGWWLGSMIAKASPNHP